MQSLYPQLSILLYKLPDGTLFTSLHTVCVRLVGGFLILIGVSPAPQPHAPPEFSIRPYISRRYVFYFKERCVLSLSS